MVLSFSRLWCNSDAQPPRSLTPTVSIKNLVPCFPQREFPCRRSQCLRRVVSTNWMVAPSGEHCWIAALLMLAQRLVWLNQLWGDRSRLAENTNSICGDNDKIQCCSRGRDVKKKKKNTDGHSFLSVKTFSWYTIIEQHLLWAQQTSWHHKLNQW